MPHILFPFPFNTVDEDHEVSDGLDETDPVPHAEGEDLEEGAVDDAVEPVEEEADHSDDAVVEEEADHSDEAVEPVEEGEEDHSDDTEEEAPVAEEENADEAVSEEGNPGGDAELADEQGTIRFSFLSQQKSYLKSFLSLSLSLID